MSNIEHSFMLPVVGAERSGKSHLAKKLGEIYMKNRGSVLVYNVGKPTDFPDSEYIHIEPLTFAEHIQTFHSEKDKKSYYKLNQEITHFRCKGRIYHFKDFSKYFYKKKVKMHRVTSRPEETAFFKSVYKYISRTLIIFDDCKVTFTYGLNDGHIQLFSRKNHAGAENSVLDLRAKGIDVLCIFHNIDHVNKEIWDYSTGLIQLYMPMQPTFKKMENEVLEIISKNTYDFLKVAPKYTAVEIPIQGIEAFKPRLITVNE